jgi:hypothetical protein
MVVPAQVAHVVYRIRRFEEMLSWYQTVFAARVQYQNPLPAFLVPLAAVVPMFQGVPRLHWR